MTSEPPLPPGSRFTPIAPLGQGGQGSVWLCRDENLDRQVAVKHLALEGRHENADAARRRALNEAKSMAKVRHPVVVPIHDVIESDAQPGSLWLVMGYIEGTSLRRLIAERDGRRPFRRSAIARIGLDVLSGLEAVHERGIVHRDVKPDNIVIAGNPDGQFGVFLVDFGIAVVEGGTRVTSKYVIVGTRGYIAPERYEGEAGSAASDLWSLGATLHCALHGEAPMLSSIGLDGTRPARSGLDGVIDRLLTRDPRRRSTAEQARKELRRIVGAARVASTPPPPPETSRSSASVGPSRWPDRASGRTKPVPREAAIRVEGLPVTVPARAAGLLFRRSDGDAARVLSEIAGTMPSAATDIMERLNTDKAARMLAHLGGAASAALLEGMDPLAAAMILRRAGGRTVAHGIRRLPLSGQAGLLREMERQNASAPRTGDTTAYAVLDACVPAHAAALARTDSWIRETVLPRVPEPARGYILRALTEEKPQG